MQGHGGETGSGEGAGAPKLLDLEDLDRRMDGDDEIAREILGVFLEEQDKLLVELTTAVRRSDPPAVRKAAHTLKGVAANVSAEALRQASLELERAAAGGDVSSAEKQLARVEDLVRRTTAAIRGHLGRP